MFPRLDMSSTSTDTAQHFLTAAMGSTVGDLDDLDYLDRDLSAVSTFPPRSHPTLARGAADSKNFPSS